MPGEDTQYYCLLTDAGAKLEADAMAAGKPVKLFQVSVGDGNGEVPTPEKSYVALLHEVYKKDIDSKYADKNDPNICWIHVVIPATEGEFWIREFGVWAKQLDDEEGEPILYAYGNHAPFYKSKSAVGQTTTHEISIPIITSSTTDIQIVLSEEGFATRQELFEDDGTGRLLQRDILPTNSPTASKLETARTISLSGTVTGSGTFDGSGDLDIATTVSTMTAATEEAAGATGLVPAPEANQQAMYLRGDATWATPTNTTYSVMKKATASEKGTAGLVPAPAAGAQAMYLRGDATWATALPIGSIVAFSGTFSGRNPIPGGSTVPDKTWVLCDGTATNGLTVPNLKGRFILGTDNNTYAVNATGGAATHTHTVTGTVANTTPTAAMIAKHSHKMKYSDIGSEGRTTTNLNDSAQGWDKTPGYDGLITNTIGSSTAHGHTFSAGKAAASSSLPPYFVLAFIMKVA